MDLNSQQQGDTSGPLSIVSVCTFTVAGNYSGSGVRVDPTMIIGKDSDCMALRVQDDD